MTIAEVGLVLLRGYCIGYKSKEVGSETTAALAWLRGTRAQLAGGSMAVITPGNGTDIEGPLENHPEYMESGLDVCEPQGMD